MYNPDFMRETFGLEGKVAVVVGAGSGIGWRVARAMANAGASVVVADWVAESAERVAAELVEAGHKAIPFTVDVSNQDQVKALFRACVEEFGNPYIMVNCAAIFPMEALADITAESWDRVHAIDLRGAFFCLQEAAALMRAEGKGGRIITISSLDAQHPAMRGLIHYGAAKAGIHGLTIHSALELGPDRITVNAVMPGNTDTEGGKTSKPIVPLEEIMANVERHNLMNRTSKPEDLAATVLFLAGEGAANITGTIIKCDGGRDIT